MISFLACVVSFEQFDNGHNAKFNQEIIGRCNAHRTHDPSFNALFSFLLNPHHRIPQSTIFPSAQPFLFTPNSTAAAPQSLP